MEMLIRAYSLLFKLYGSLTPGSRWTAGLLAALTLLAAGFLLTSQGSVSYMELMQGVSIPADQLPGILAAFAKANLQGYKLNGTSVRVPSGQEAAYLTALAEAKALPKDFGAAQREAVNGDNLINYGSREQRMKIAKQDDLALAIGKMNGIERAYVLYDVDNRPGGFKDKLITATACVKPVGSCQLDEARVSDIRLLVAGSIAGLKPENVTVSDLNGRTWYGNLDVGDADGNAYITLKRTCEQDLKAKILNVLHYIPSVVVETNVELVCERLGKKKLALNRADEQSGGSGAHGLEKKPQTSPAGTACQQSNAAAVLKALLGGSESVNEAAQPEDANSNERGPAVRNSASWTPALAKVSVGVPNSYVKKIWRNRNAVEPGKPLQTPDQIALERIRLEVSEKIQRHVAPLLPSAAGAAKTGELVAVTAYEDLPGVDTPVLSLREEMLSWARQSWKTLLAAGLALIGLLVLKSMIRSVVAAVKAPAVAPRSESEDVAAAERTSEVPAPHAKRFYRVEPALRNELSRLVEDDPEKAANVLRNWIGQVG